MNHAEFETLLAAAIDGRADEAQREALRKLLREDAALRAEYAGQLQLHALLHWRAGGASAEVEGADAKVIAFPATKAAWWMAAAAVLVAAVGAALWLSPRARPTPVAERVEFEVIEAVDVVANEENFRAGARLALSRLQMQSGLLRFRLSSGAVVTVTGAADVQLIDPMRLRVARGQLTADVGDDAKGFVVETAQTKVVDLGTKFGVDVADSGHTDVVVFEGSVELFDHRQSGRDAPAMAQLVEGEAVRVDARQQLSRIANVTSSARDENWSTHDADNASAVIASVRDNLHNPRAREFYRIIRGGMHEDARAFIAKRHEWNGRDAAGLPGWLLDADLVQTFGTGKANANLEMSVTLARPAIVYVFVDDRLPPPAWLEERFTDTGAKIGLENAPSLESRNPVARGPGAGNLAPFAVWKREMPDAGSITLGAPPDAPTDRPHWMYGIAAKAL